MGLGRPGAPQEVDVESNGGSCWLELARDCVSSNLGCEPYV